MKSYRYIAALTLGVGLLSAQPEPDPADRIRTLNEQLIALRGEPGIPIDRASQLISLRLAAFADLAATDPEGALSLLLPEANLAPLRTMAPAIAAGLESEGEWSGPIDVVAEDDFQHHTSKVHLSLQAGAEKLQVFATPPTHLQTRDIVRAAGVRMGRMLLVRRLSLVRKAAAAASACTSTGVQHLAIVMVNFASSSLNTAVINSASLGAIVNGGSHNLTGYWHEASYGLTTAAADVYGPFNLGADYTGRITTLYRQTHSPRLPAP